eukprot:756074-Pleurochrysis_carterae.AAC.1
MCVSFGTRGGEGTVGTAPFIALAEALRNDSGSGDPDAFVNAGLSEGERSGAGWLGGRAGGHGGGGAGLGCHG